MCVTIAGILGLMIFNFIRSFKKQNGLVLFPHKNYESAQTDFLDAQINVTGIVISQTVPIIIAHFIRIMCQKKYPEDYGLQVINFEHPFAFFQFFSIFYIIFMSYHKGSKNLGLRWMVWWLRIGPKIHIALILINFVIIPIIILIHWLNECFETDYLKS